MYVKDRVIFLDMASKGKMFICGFVFFRYYNVHSICLADIFPRWDDPYAALSLTLIIFNFFAFFYIAGVYLTVHFITFKNKTSSADHSEAGW